jgi:glutathione S-transferase
MILIGQYDSPFVRHVAVAMRHYGLSYEHRPWSVWAAAEALPAFAAVVQPLHVAF